MIIPPRIKRTLLDVSEKISFPLYPAAFVFLLVTITYFSNPVSIRSTQIIIDFEFKDTKDAGPFDYFEYRTKTGSNAEFIKKAFDKHGLKWSEAETETGALIQGAYRAPESDHSESLALVFKYQADKTKCSGFYDKKVAKRVFSGAALMLNYLEYVKQVKWLSKDIIFVAFPKNDDRTKEIQLIEDWVNKYISGGSTKPLDHSFVRAGRIVSALVLDIPCDTQYHSFDISSRTRMGFLANADAVFSTAMNLRRNGDFPFTLFSLPDLNKIFAVSTQNYRFLANSAKNHLHWRLLEVFENAAGFFKFNLYHSIVSERLLNIDCAFIARGIDAMTLKSIGVDSFFDYAHNNKWNTFLTRYLSYFLRMFSNLDFKLRGATNLFVAISESKLYNFNLSVAALLFFLSPIILHLIRFYFDHDANENRALLQGLKIALLLVSTGAFVLISPLISLNSIYILTPMLCAVLASAVYCSFKAIKSVERSEEYLTACVFGFLCGSVCQLCFVNYSQMLIVAVTLTPFFFLCRGKSSVGWKIKAFVFFAELNFLGCFLPLLHEFRFWKYVFQWDFVYNLNWFCFCMYCVPVILTTVLVNLKTGRRLSAKDAKREKVE